MIARTYDSSHFDATASVEERHFWFQARNQMIARMFLSLPGSKKWFLDVGCGTGNVLRHMVPSFPETTFVGCDLFPEALQIARKRSDAFFSVADEACLPFKKIFDVAGVFDVIEHLDDDLAALRNVSSVLRPGGSLLITVPAGPELWSGFDIVSFHRRRYTRKTLVDVIAAAGLTSVFCSYCFAFPYPLLRLSRTAESKVDRELALPAPINSLLGFLTSWEADWLARRKNLPFGSSLFAVARKP